MIPPLPTLTKYIVGIIARNFAIITGIFFFVVLGSRSADILSSYTSRNLPVDTLLSVIWGFVPETLLVVFSLATFMSVILTITSLNISAVTPILYSSGLSTLFLVRCVLIFIAPLIPLMLWLSLSYVPTVKQIAFRAFQQAERGINVVMEGGRLQSFGNNVMYAESMTDDGDLNGFFIRYHSAGKPFLISASTTNVFTRNGVRWARVHDGYQLEDAPHSSKTRLTKFTSLEIALPDLSGRDKVDAIIDSVPLLPLSALWQRRDGLFERIEVHWRFSYIISSLLMACIAAFLVPYRPRSSRLSSVVVGLVIFVIYASALTSIKQLAEKGGIHPDLGFGGVYFLTAMVLTLLIVAHRTQWP